MTYQDCSVKGLSLLSKIIVAGIFAFSINSIFALNSVHFRCPNPAEIQVKPWSNGDYYWQARVENVLYAGDVEKSAKPGELESVQLLGQSVNCKYSNGFLSNYGDTQRNAYFVYNPASQRCTGDSLYCQFYFEQPKVAG